MFFSLFWVTLYQLAMREVRSWLVVRLFYNFCVCIPTYQVHNNYVTYIVAMQLYFSLNCRRLV